MYIKSIEYTDFGGVTRKENFYFNFTKAELIEMDATEPGGLKQKLNDMVDLKDTVEIFKRMKQIVLSSYGKKSADGRTFEKSPELAKQFEQSAAYSELIMEFISNPDSFNDFLRGIMPSVDASKIVALPERN